MLLWGTKKLIGWWRHLDWVHADGQHSIQTHPVMRVFGTYFANLMQNCVKYFRVEARLSRMMGTFCLM